MGRKGQPRVRSVVASCEAKHPWFYLSHIMYDHQIIRS